MVTFEKDCVVIFSPTKQKINHVARMRSSIDVIADEDGERSLRGAFPAVGLDAAKQSAK